MATAAVTGTELAGRLRQLIGRSGLKQADLGRRLGENPQWLSARVLGKHELTGVDIVRMAAALGVSPYAFFEEVAPRRRPFAWTAKASSASARQWRGNGWNWRRMPSRTSPSNWCTISPATAEAVVMRLREGEKGRAREVASRKTAELARQWEDLSEEEQPAEKAPGS